LFLLVKTQNNYIIYGAIIVGMESGSNIFNLFNLKKYIDIKKEYFKELNIKRHAKPIMTIFVATISVSIYLQLDAVMIGSIAGPEYVGFYSVANKLVKFVMILVTALGAVMMPRLSNCLKVGDKKGYINYANYSLKYILFISIPSMVGVSLVAKQIIEIMAGENFTESILTMQIISPIIFIVGLAYFIGFQVLYPQGLEKYYTYSVTIAAIINFVFNYTFIPKYYQNGAAIGTVIAELTGVLMMLYFAKDKLKELEFWNFKNLKYILSAIIMGVVIILIKTLNLNNIYTLVFSISLGGLTYITSLILLKEEITIQGLNIIKKRILKM
ncbi:MAG: polysaccharide biosynthesis C-terminal domain-containing protein, partial [Fusobacteriaceae bacterium]